MGGWYVRLMATEIADLRHAAPFIFDVVAACTFVHTGCGAFTALRGVAVPRAAVSRGA